MSYARQGAEGGSFVSPRCCTLVIAGAQHTPTIDVLSYYAVTVVVSTTTAATAALGTVLLLIL